MRTDKPQVTTDELFELLKRTSLTTILVEGKDDIIFYRKIEEELREYNIDMLPAGNKNSVLELRDRISQISVLATVIFIVDKDLWVHSNPGEDLCPVGVLTTDGYSIENDLFADGDIEALLDTRELDQYHSDIVKFLKWYALAVSRALHGKDSAFRTHPGKVLDDIDFYLEQTKLSEGEAYPVDLLDFIKTNYKRVLRGKSLIAIAQRRFSANGRDVKHSTKQLIAFGASRRGENFRRICKLIRGELA
ncbi:DUF4435 domain-containing protein (plasmid) [Lichenicola cladoniae]|uniref:DUF4435 domain-containing protein n=2 Tax=Lichenicola cladoniae TaxID=1484109 RepID=A0A6M8I1E3_9PROT|nr:DUF4435 domain-containing protein [Acetobacteraceae bacterium]QKE94046.1 DUF4435 domain-containing protein [Lichenicola cladoniae]